MSKWKCDSECQTEDVALNIELNGILALNAKRKINNGFERQTKNVMISDWTPKWKNGFER